MPEPLGPVWDLADAREAVCTFDRARGWPSEVFDRLRELELLRPLANATSVVCDGCGGDHVETVEFVQTPPGSDLRGYIWCPENGRTFVALDRLRRWEVDFGRLAELTASALGLSGEARELAPSRVWLLGRTMVAQRRCEVFLARGLNWADAADVVAAAGLTESPGVVVLVAGRLPGDAIWAGRRPAVLALRELLSVDQKRLAADRSQLESVGDCGDRPRRLPTTSSFPTPAGVAWTDVCITTTDLNLRIEAAGRTKSLSFQEAGFEERRRGGVPDRLWRLLNLFAACGGVLPFDSPRLDGRERDNLKQNVSRLGKRLIQLLQIEGSPFKDARKTRRYETRFKLQAEDGLSFPTPADCGWDDVSIHESRAGVVRVSVRGTESFSTYTPSGGREAGRWEAAQEEASLTRDYDLRVLGLADASGTPVPAGAALLAVLRAGGRISRPADDVGLLALCRRLSQLTQIDGPPFQFAKTRSVWSAVFEATSDVGDSAR